MTSCFRVEGNGCETEGNVDSAIMIIYYIIT